MVIRTCTRALSLLFALLLTVFIPVQAGGSASADLTELTAGLDFPDLSQRVRYHYAEDSDLASLDLDYEDVTLRQLLRLMASLEREGWCLKENGAFRYAVGLAIDWNQEGAGLSLGFRRPLHAAQWPELVSPCLALEIPVFPTGLFRNPRFAREPLRNMEAVVMECDGAGLEKMLAYEETLVRAGYANRVEGADSLFVRGGVFVVTSWDETNDRVHLYLGWMPVQYVPLPPWPDPLPENIKRMLPAPAAIVTVAEETGLYRAQAQGLSLSDLYRFYKSALSHYGWQEGSLEDEILHPETGWRLRSLGYNARSEVWSALIHHSDLKDSSEGNPTVETNTTPPFRPTRAPSPQPTPGPTAVPNLPRFALTQATCTQDGIMETVFAEFGQSAVVADWEALKEAFGAGLPEELDRMGFENRQCAWLRARNSFNWSADRYYFIQRFDEEAPPSFMAHDRVGTIYLGSWRDIPARVLLQVIKFCDP